MSNLEDYILIYLAQLFKMKRNLNILLNLVLNNKVNASQLLFNPYEEEDKRFVWLITLK